MAFRTVDLSMELYEGMPKPPLVPRAPLLWTVHPHFLTEGVVGGGASYANEHFLLTGHIGTHADAPFHINPSGVTVEKLPVDDFYGSALLLDVAADFANRPRSAVGPADLIEAERRSGSSVQARDIVIIRTGWGERYRELGDTYIQDAPGLTLAAGEWLAERRVKTVGIDTSTVDRRHAEGLPEPEVAVHSGLGQSCPVHVLFYRTLMPAYINIIENLCNLGAIRQPRFTFAGFPLPLRGATGTPIRAVAIEEID